jgi:glycosyltransferase involved in cell wall biosynthesis
MEPATLVSVGLPVYNGEQWLKQTIDSVLSQTWCDLELVISDNASTDRTEELCRTYANTDPRVRYHRNAENIGLSRNFNKVFELSRGGYFKWTSCSDIIDPTFIEKCVETFEKRPDLDLIYPSTRLFETDPNVGVDHSDSFDLDVDSPYERFIRYVNGVALNNIMHGLFRTKILRMTRGYKKFVGADYNLLAEFVLYGRVAHLPEVLHFRRMTPETFTGYLNHQQGIELYEPKNRGQIAYHEIQRAFDYFVIAARAPVNVIQRLKLMIFAIRSAYWNRKNIVAEFAAGMRQLRANMSQNRAS